MSFWLERDGTHIHALTGVEVKACGKRYSVQWEGVDLRGRAHRSQYWHSLDAAKRFADTLVSTEFKGLQLTGRIQRITRGSTASYSQVICEYGSRNPYVNVILVDVPNRLLAPHPDFVEGCKVAMHCLMLRVDRGVYATNSIEARHIKVLAPPEPVIPPAARVWVAPERPVEPLRRRKSVFLAGTIDNGASDDWQAQAIESLAPLAEHIFNPRREAWDPQWVGSKDHPEFKKQVNWELDHIEDASLVLIYFAPGSLSPITLLELGLLAERSPRKILVCCPDPFWRKGNVDVLCERKGIACFDRLGDMLDAARTRLESC